MWKRSNLNQTMVMTKTVYAIPAHGAPDQTALEMLGQTLSKDRWSYACCPSRETHIRNSWKQLTQLGITFGLDWFDASWWPVAYTLSL